MLQFAEQLDESIDLIALTTIDGPVLYINPAGLALLGLDQWSPDISFLDHRPEWAIHMMTKEAIPMAIDLGGWKGECAFSDAEGHSIPVHQTVYVLRNAEGDRDLILIIARRITEVARQVSPISDYVGYYRLFFQRSAEAIYLLDTETHEVAFANPAFYSYLGYAPETEQPLKIYDFVAHERSSVDAYLGSVRESGEVNIGLRQWRRRDGTKMDVMVSVMYLEHGVKPMYFVTAWDVSERIQAEARLRESEQRFRSLVERLNDGLLYVDNDDKILFVNDQFVSMTGFSREELIGRIAWQVLLQGPALAAMKKRLETRQALANDNYEILITRKSGESRWFQNSSARMTDGNGHVIGSIGLLRDIHDQKTTAEALKSKMAELDTFVYKASHDLKAPLNSLQGLIGLAKSEAESPTMQQYLGMMERKTAKLHTLLMGLLEISVIKEGRFSPETFGLSTLLDVILEHFDYKANQKGITIQRDVPNDYMVTADPKIFESTLQNLIGNAVNYHRVEGEGRFVRIAAETRDGQQLIIVEDNGTGIPEEIQAKVFDMFYRGSNDAEGTGLGLYIVKNGIEKMGGTVRMFSAAGEGTRFEVWLP